MCERVQRQVRVSFNPLAVALRNRPMLRRALTRFAPLRPSCTGRPDLVLRLKINALILKATMVDPDLVPQLGQALVGARRPRRAPTLKLGNAVPLRDLAAEPLWTSLAHREHDMGVWL